MIMENFQGSWHNWVGRASHNQTRGFPVPVPPHKKDKSSGGKWDLAQFYGRVHMDQHSFLLGYPVDVFIWISIAFY